MSLRWQNLDEWWCYLLQFTWDVANYRWNICRRWLPLWLRKTKYLQNKLLVLQHSQLFLTNLMKQSEVPVLSQSQQFRYFVAHILYSIVFCHSHHFYFVLWHCINVYLHFLCFSLLCLSFFIQIMVNVPSKFYFSSTQ